MPCGMIVGYETCFDISENGMSIPVTIQTGVYLLKGFDGNKQVILKIVFK